MIAAAIMRIRMRVMLNEEQLLFGALRGIYYRVFAGTCNMGER